MLLTIHNLPPSCRYSDIKGLLSSKCGLTEILLDNLVTEGKGKKVTVGVASDDDGALVVRKINGMFLDGHQLYIEDRRRKTAAHDQPYRSSASMIQESRGAEPVHTNNMMAGGMVAANVPVMWNYNMATPYMVQVPVDQNFAYSGYGGAPQAAQYMEPQPVVPAENERGYSGFQGESYSPSNVPRDQEPAWARSGRDQGSDGFRHHDRKHQYSPERPPVAKKSRWNEKEAPMRREASPPRQQWPQEMNQGPRPPFRQSEQLARNQNQYPPREPKPDYRRTEPQRENRWDDPNPDYRRTEPQRGNRWDDPNPDYRRTEPQRENRWDDPKPREWDNDNNRNWEPQTDKVWVDPPNQQWRDEPRQRDIEPTPQWEPDYPRIPEKEVLPERFDRQRENPPNRYPGDQGFSGRGPHERDSRPQQRDDFENRRQNDRNAPRDWNLEPMPERPSVGPGPGRSVSSSNRNARRDEPPRRDRSRSDTARGRDRRDNRPNPSEDRPGGNREKPDYWKQIANDYPESKRPEPARRELNPPRHDKKPTYKPQPQKKPAVREEKRYPPVEDRRVPPRKPIEPRFENPKKKPQTLTALINKDSTNRGQAAALIAKKILKIDTSAKLQHTTPLDAIIFKQLKWCIKSRIDVLLGEELSSNIDDVVGRYRSKFPTSGDKALAQQIQEKSSKELEAQMREEDKINSRKVKKEKEDVTATQTQNEATGSNETNTEATNEVAKPAVEHTGENKSIVIMAKQRPRRVKTKGNKHITDKQLVQYMKLQRRWEYDEDDYYNLDDSYDEALDDELAEMGEFFGEGCSWAMDPQEELLSKLVTTDCLNDFDKTIRLFVAKRILNIPTGLTLRVCAPGKLPRKTSVKKYLKQYKLNNMTLKKNVKGVMYLGLNNFPDFDNLCHVGTDTVDDIPITFKAMHLIGPQPKLSKNQIMLMQESHKKRQIKKYNMDEFKETSEYTLDGNTDDVKNANLTEDDNNPNDQNVDINDSRENFITGNVKDDNDDDFTEDIDIGNIEASNDNLTENIHTGNVESANNDDFTEDVSINNLTEVNTDKRFTEDVANDNFTEDANIENINEEDLEDFGINDLTEVNTDKGFTEDVANDNFTEDANIENINEEDLEDFSINDLTEVNTDKGFTEDANIENINEEDLEDF